jgi:hypothetical protein
VHRETILRRVLDHLGPTPVGRRFGLPDIDSLADFRASVPILDRERHVREVEAALGFGVIDGRDAAAAELAGRDDERTQVLAAWRSRLAGAEESAEHDHAVAPRVALLRAEGDDGLAERTLLADVRALGDTFLRVDQVDDPAKALVQLRAFDPEVLVVPSAMVCTWLERAKRMPLEDGLPRLRLVLAEHDIGRPLRTRTPIASAGWFWHGLRAGVPSPRAPADAVTLAVGTALFELLPYTNPEDDGRRIYAEQTVLPEHALVGHRYEVVCTSALGLLRVRTEQHVRVVGFDPPTPLAPFPRPRVVRLSTPPADVALEGCTVGGSWLTASVRQALSREDPALVGAEIGPDPASAPRGSPRANTTLRLGEAFGETELEAGGTKTKMRRDALRRPKALLCRIELQGYVRRDLPARLSTRIDDSLRRRSPAYAWLRERGELDPPRVIVQPAGTRASDQQARILALHGPVWMPEVRVVGA